MADLLVWTAGSQPSSLVESLDVPKDLRGRIEVDRRLRLVSAAVGEGDGRAGGVGAAGDVYCLGDIAAVEGLDLGCNAQVYNAYGVQQQSENGEPPRLEIFV